MPFIFPVLTYTGLLPVLTIQLCPPPAPHYSLGPEVGGASTAYGVDGSSAALNDGDDGDDEDVNEEVNVQALRPKRRKSEVWRSMTRTQEPQEDGTIKVFAICKGYEKKSGWGGASKLRDEPPSLSH